MSAPLKKYKFKAIEVCYWGNGKFSVKKEYKPKDSPEWKKTNTYFREELIELERLIHTALSEPIDDKKPIEITNQLPQSEGQDFEDDDITFKGLL
jgi:hypothetical protein